VDTLSTHGAKLQIEASRACITSGRTTYPLVSIDESVEGILPG